ncbi:MAG: ATP-binding cassette domain-containing protein [Candidatus Delongbacteria bacterium]|nr:ATP-binding cassette domain-containing protein [Candidatus Delongbacteria bacterium]
MIKIRNLVKEYKKFNGIKIVCSELDISKGDIVGIYGNVGSGKTLFTKILAGVHKKYNGVIEFGMISSRSVPKKTLSFIPSSNILYTGLTLIDHIKFFGSEFKVNKTEITAKINWFDKFFNVNRNLDRKIYSFSKGELQYVKIFLSLLHSPSLVIIDELFTGFGNDDINSLYKLFEELSEREVTILFTSSHLEYIKALTENIIYIKNGSIDI